MVKVLNDNVYLDGVRYATGTTPEDPAVVDRIGDHAWRETDPTPEPPVQPSVEPEQPVAPASEVPLTKEAPEPDTEPGDPETPGPEAPETPSDPAPDPEVDPVPMPNRGGPGSGKDAWAAYARANNVSIEAGANRDDIIDALDEAGIPTE